VKAKAFTVDADQIDEIQFKPASGEASQAEKANGTWQLTEPEKTESDQGQLSNAASSLAMLEINRVVDDNPGDADAVRPEPAKAGHRLPGKGQKDIVTAAREKTATGSDMYARRPIRNGCSWSPRIWQHVPADSVRPPRQVGAQCSTSRKSTASSRARGNHRAGQERQRVDGDKALQDEADYFLRS